MPKRISDVSLHVYVTPETLQRIVATVCTALDDHLSDRDIFAWRFTLPVADDDPRHREFDTRWRRHNPDRDPDGRATYEIALGLVGDPAELTDTDMTTLERRLTAGLDAAATGVPFTISARQRIDTDREPIPEPI
ncbi:hypothetical protein [Nocardia brevicatena]|uniref:hypothetical protein n=1 Tax=Nocardia brevicatena TaxID=37327 RepID=UPI0002FC411C|nr:hypothetical protein [Nocardia brevicatena]